MNHELKLGTLIFMGIFLVLSIGFCFWQHFQNESQHRQNKKNVGDDFGGWACLKDADFNKN